MDDWCDGGFVIDKDERVVGWGSLLINGMKKKGGDDGPQMGERVLKANK